MKKYCMVMFLILPCAPIFGMEDLIEDDANKFVFVAKQHNGRSFMFTRPGYMNLAAHNQLWHDIIFNKQGNLLGAFQITPFYQQSIPTQKSERYFLIHHKTHLRIAGDDTIYKKTRDVRAEWLGLPDDFSGIFSLKPEQKQAGFIIEYQQDLRKFTDMMFFKDWRFGVTMPVVWVKNFLHPRQSDVKNKGTTVPTDIVQAFDQSRWCFGKITNHQSKIQLAELKFTFESAYYAKNHCFLAYHTSLSLPTSAKQNPRYLFDPIVGYNGHVVLGAGLDIQFLLNRDISRIACCYFISLENNFLIKNRQYRTFDLKNKPWSRFLLFNRSDGKPNANIPGVNILTLEATIRPYCFVDFTTGWRVQTNYCSIEIGYDIWGHDSEKIRDIHEYFPDNLYGIATQQNDTATEPETASTSTIKKLGPTDVDSSGNPVFVPIYKSDIHLESAATAPAFNHKAHFAIGYKNNDKKNAFFVGVGGFIEIPQKNGALENWGFWAKIGASL